MVKDFIPLPYDGENPLPTYVTNLKKYVLIGTTSNNYKVTLAKLTVGESISLGNMLTHALFKSYNDHGERMIVKRTRVSGCEGEYWAVRNAMFNAGVEFENVTSCSGEEMLKSLGDWFCEHNKDIKTYAIMSHTRH